jgi:hypothetical protein
MLEFKEGRRDMGASAGRGRSVRVSKALEEGLSHMRSIDVHILVVVAVREDQLCLL